MKKLNYDQIDEIVYTETLPNGLEVFLLPRPEMSKTYSVFTTDYGSIDHTFVPLGEADYVTVPKGVAHFLEHKLFEKEDRDVFTDFGQQGASPNAYTSFTETAYLFSATENIEANVTTLLDFVQEPYFTDETVEKEKGIIVQELKMYLDQADGRVFMDNLQAMFKHHPVRNDIIGTEASVNATTKEDLYTCYKTFYHPSNMILILAGNFDAVSMMDLIRENQAAKTFAEPTEIERFMPEEPAEVNEAEKILHMPVSTPKCIVGIKEYAHELSQDELLMRLIVQPMVIEHFYGVSGVFYQALYDTGLIGRAYMIDATIEADHGFSLIGGDVKDPGAFVAKVKEQLLQTNEMALSAAELERMKKKRIGQVLRGMNSLEYTVRQYISYHRFGLDFFELIPAIQAITLDEINGFIKNWISPERIAVSKVLPE